MTEGMKNLEWVYFCLFLGSKHQHWYGSNMEASRGREQNSSLENVKDPMSNWIKINQIQFVKTLKLEHLYSYILSVSKIIHFHYVRNWRVENSYILKKKKQHKSCICKAGEHSDLVTTFLLACPHDSTLLIVYFMSEIKQAPHKDTHWCHRAAELRYLTASHVSNSKPGFVWGREPLSEHPGFRGVGMLLFWISIVAGDFQFIWKNITQRVIFFTKMCQSSNFTFHLKWPFLPSSHFGSILCFLQVKKTGFHNEDIDSAGVFICPPAHQSSGSSLGPMSRTRRSTRFQSQTGTRSLLMCRVLFAYHTSLFSRK